MNAEIVFEIVEYDSQKYHTAISLCEDILRKPLGLRFSQHELERDENDIHIVGSLDGKVVATAMLIPEGDICKMRRVAIHVNLQSQGIGSAMLKYCEDQAIVRGFSAIYCHARKTAVGFYSKNGYMIEGDYFEENNIPHLKMKKSFSV